MLHLLDAHDYFVVGSAAIPSIVALSGAAPLQGSGLETRCGPRSRKGEDEAAEQGAEPIRVVVQLLSSSSVQGRPRGAS